MVRTLVHDIGTVLAPGGMAQMLGKGEVRVGEDWRERIEQWLDEAYLTDFVARRVEAVGLGMVTLRRPADGTVTMRRLEEHEGSWAQPLGPHVAHVVATHDWLVARTDDEVMAERWVVAPDVTRETYGRPTLPDPEHILLRHGGGLGGAVKADTALAGCVGTCDGELTGAQIAGALAALLDVDAAAVRTGLAAAVRELARDGMLLRA